MKAASHPDQARRLETLHGLDILDTDRESEFDDVVNLASRVCGCAISVINLIDEHRQWFKAETGLGVRETPLETSLCSHVILEDDFVEIRDTLSDPRMRDNPLCLGDPGLRFYAGALLRARNGLPVGTLCVLDHVPRELTEIQRETIRVLANQVMRMIELRAALAREEVLRREVDHRVKNSLQAVSSLTRLQARNVSGDDVRAALDVVAQRIDTVAALHEELYRTAATDRIDLRQFLGNIAEFVGQSCPSHVTLDLDVDAAVLGSDQAAAVSVIVNEFATNSIKHAFPGKRAGTIRIKARERANGTVTLVCEDDGVGLLEPVDDAKGLGMKIMGASTHRLGGTFELVPADPGTRLEVVFVPARGAPSAATSR